MYVRVQAIETQAASLSVLELNLDFHFNIDKKIFVYFSVPA